jgi:hypothetical protein
MFVKGGLHPEQIKALRQMSLQRTLDRIKRPRISGKRNRIARTGGGLANLSARELAS